MSHYTPTNDQIQALVRYASAKLGMTPEQLVSTIQNGQVSNLSKNMSSNDAKKLESMLQNNGQAAQFLQSPAVQQYIANFLNNKP